MFDISKTIADPKFIHLATGVSVNLSSVRSRARFREFVHTLGRVVTKPTHQRVCAVTTRQNTQN